MTAATADTRRYDFDTVVDRRPTSSSKWNRYRGRDNIIPLWVADMDFRSAPEVIEALHARVDHGIFGYTDPPEELAQAVKEHLRSDFGWAIDTEWLVWLPGLVSGLNVACRAAGGAGDQAAIFTPVYPPFMTAPRHAGMEVLRVPLREEGETWLPDPQRLEETLSPRTRLFILCNPHNPVGRVFSRDELLEVAQVCLRRSLVICSDEIHAGLVLDPHKRHIPLASLSPEIAARTVTLLAPSKTYNIPGLGCAFAVIPDPGLRRAFQRAMRGIVPHVNLLGYTAALAAYTRGESWRRQLLDYLRGNRDLVAERLNALPRVRVNRPEATCLAWVDVRSLGTDRPGAFFEEAGVGLSEGDDFGGPGFLRLNFGCPRSLLEEALARMERGVAGLA